MSYHQHFDHLGHPVARPHNTGLRPLATRWAVALAVLGAWALLSHWLEAAS